MTSIAVWIYSILHRKWTGVAGFRTGPTLIETVKARVQVYDYSSNLCL
ncbi:hypothetical protein PAMC26510_09825 [Caballeronia sordidicola]|uniref:Uncharacterized protein n=1 Tax=Caballeronia sordidicola TaxID=196367 RepID=A0A242MZ41_CABSO|nr:hypothetical protein PAMC26510_09825 [Caballeronia sordidicola]